MRKSNFLLMLLFLSSFFVSCNNSDDKIELYKKDNIDAPIEINSVEQLNSITNYDSAMIYAYKIGCQYCEMTKTNLLEYIKNTNVVVYEVECEVYKAAYKVEQSNSSTSILYPKLNGFPAFLFYKDGKIVNYYVNSISSYSTMENLFDKYTYSTETYILNDVNYLKSQESYSYTTPEEYELTKDLDTLGYSTIEMDELINTKQDITILYSWRRCSDCKNFKNDVLNKYRETHKENKLYIYEMDGYFLLKRNDDEQLKEFGLNLYAEFCDKYKLSLEYGTYDILNNYSGYVPTLVNYNYASDNVIKTCVYQNEDEIIRNSDGTISYSKAFFQEVKTIKSNSKVEDNDFISEKYQKAKKELDEKVLKMDNKLCLKFLEDYL